MVKEQLKELLKNLSDIDGVSGQEQSVIKAILSEISPLCDEITVTPSGNVKPGPAIAVGAHMDQIGFIVKAILPSGFLLMNKVGGAPNNILLARKVWVGDNKIPGIIGTKPGHMQTPEEASKAATIENCYVDIGVSSKEEAEKMGITTGTQITFQSDFMEMSNPDLICTRSIDDRMCCAVIIELLRNINKEDYAGDFYGIFTVKEEVGLKGSLTALDGLPVDYAIAIDTIPATDTPEIANPYAINIKLGGGPALPVSEGNDRFFSMIHPAVRDIIEKSASNIGVNLQLCSMLGIAYGTDASSFAYANGGTPAAAIAVPRRYSHSPVELVNLNDAVDLYNLLVEMIKNNEQADLSFI